MSLILISGPVSSESSSLFSDCSDSFSCGNITGVTFPFWGGIRPSGCGYPPLELTCEENSTFVSIASVKYLVLGLESETQLLRIARQDFSNGICLKEYRNTTLDSELFDLAPGYVNFSFMYGCPSMSSIIPGHFSCPGNGSSPDGYVSLAASWPSSCYTSVIVPLPFRISAALDSGSADLPSILQEGFEVKLKVDSEACSECVQSNGVCGYDPIANGITCFCPGLSSGSTSCSSTSKAPTAAPLAEPRQGNHNLFHAF